MPNLSMVHEIPEKILVFSSCLCLGFFLYDPAVLVLPVLLSISCSALLSYFESDKIKASLYSIFIVLHFFNPLLALFLPLILFDCLFSRLNFWAFGFILSVYILSAHVEASVFLLFTPLLMLSALLKYKSQVATKLKTRFYSLQDKSNELLLKLESQNKKLLESQYSEIHMARLNERNRIAREIHDNVGHLLSRSLLQTGALMVELRNSEALGSLANVKETLDQAMSSIRESVHKLHESSLDLESEVQRLVEEFSFCEACCAVDLLQNPERTIQYAIIGIVKEALVNVSKHSNASLVNIRLKEHPAFYQLAIADNGTHASYKETSGIGLRNIHDRIESFHGNINVLTEEGFQIFMTIPKDEA